MNNINRTESKIFENKQIKRENLLSSAYTLFVRKGLNDTSISDITDNAGVAKGTFYLYFKDKCDIYEKAVIEKTRLLFDEAFIDTNNKNIIKFPDKLINMIDYIINSLTENIELTKFINKNLSLGFYSNVEDIYNIKDTITQELKEYNKKIKEPNVTLYMIIELVSSSCYNSIINNIPMSINDYKPIMFNEIKKIIN